MAHHTRTSLHSLAGAVGLASASMKRNMLAVGLALLALLALMVAALLVAPHAHADRPRDNVYFNGLVQDGIEPGLSGNSSTYQ
jgi:hypothetical protein